MNRDRVVFVLACTVAAFVILSLVGITLLAFYGKATVEVWLALFSLVTAVVGAIAGYIAGKGV